MNSGVGTNLAIMKLPLCGYSLAEIVAISTNNWLKPGLGPRITGYVSSIDGQSDGTNSEKKLSLEH